MEDKGYIFLQAKHGMRRQEEFTTIAIKLFLITKWLHVVTFFYY